MPDLKPLRSYDEHEVLPFYAYSGSYPVKKGTFVKIPAGSGFMGQDLDIIGAAGATYVGVESPRWGLQSVVQSVSSTGDYVLGMLLYDGKETDENGEQLKFRPRKQTEMQVFLSGQAAPIVTKGEFLYSGISGTVVPNAPLYFDPLTAGLMTVGVANNLVGKALGNKNAEGFAYVKIDL